MEKNMNIHQALFFSFLKKAKPIEQKKIINISYLIMVQIKIRLLQLLVLSRYGLAFTYRIIFQISIYNWMQNCISGIAFSYFEKDQYYALSRQKTDKMSTAIVRATPKMLSATKILSASTAKMLEVEQGRFLKTE